MKTRELFRLTLATITAILFSVNVFAQQTVKGILRASSGEPLSGATISIKGKNKSVLTDSAGNFSISAAPPDILVASFIGYASQETRVGNSTSVSMTLSAMDNNMDEVVVVGYGTTSRKNLTTAIAKVDPKKVPQAANNSVAQLLFGRAAGLQVVQQSAEPGGNINLSIRGRGNPLIVVDGVVMPYTGLEPGNGTIGGDLNGVHRGGFAGLNPADIESIEVLKDGSASIYGVNAGNGVILITTKKGRAGRLSISYDGSHSWVKNMAYLKPLNATDYMTTYNKLALDKYLIDNHMAPFGANDPAGYIPKFSDADIQKAGAGTDWLGLVLRDGSIENHTLAVNGGTDKIVYYFSGNYFNQVGTMKGSGVTKYTGKMNLSMHLAKFITLNTNVIAAKNNFTNSTAGWQTGGAGNQGFGALQAALAYPSYLPVRDSSGRYTTFITTGNPVSLLDIQDKTSYSSLFANISADVTIIPSVLTGKLLYGNNAENATRDFFIPSTVFYNQVYLSRGALTESRRQYQTAEATLTFKKAIKDVVNIDAVAGLGQYITDENSFTAQGAGMKDALGTTALSAAPSSIGIGSYKTNFKTRSYFARASFDFLDRYVLSLIYRYDGYSNFFPQSKYAGFPSASVAWKISEESFLKDSKTINLLKVRASWGTTGLTNGSVAYGSFSPDFFVTFNNGSSQYIPYYLSGLNDPSLTWPKTINKNIGLDFGLFKDRIAGSLDFFKDDFTRILTTDNTAPLSQIYTHWINAGHQVRKGYEVNVNTVNVRMKAFEWSSLFNVSHVNYAWKERFPNQDVSNYAGVTDPVNSIYVFKTNGILQTGETAPAWQPANAALPGDPIFVDVNGDKRLDSADVVRYNVDPKITIGFGNTFRYKDFDLQIMFYGQFGGTNYNYLRSWSDPAGFVAGGQSGIKELSNAWTTTNTSGTWPGVAYNESALGLLTGADSRLESTDFVRCRNITLGYTINAKAINKYFKTLRLFVDVQNAFILTKYKIADPEVQAVPVKGGPAPYPMARTYSFGIKANL